MLTRSVMRPSSQPTDIVPYVTAPQEPAELDPFEDLLDVLDLKTVGAAHISVDSPGDDESDLGDSEADIFVGRSQPMPHGRVFGGQVLAQSIIAAGRTVEDGRRRPPAHPLPARLLPAPGRLQPADPVRGRAAARRPLVLGPAGPRHPVRQADPVDDHVVPDRRRRPGPPGLDARRPPTPSSCRPRPRSSPASTTPISGIWSTRQSIDLRHVEGSHLRRARPAAGGPAERLAQGRRRGCRTTRCCTPPSSPTARTTPCSRRCCAGTAWPGRTRGCAPPASTTRCGSTARRAPTSGLLYTQESPSASGGRGPRHRADVRRRRHAGAPRSPRRACCASRSPDRCRAPGFALSARLVGSRHGGRSRPRRARGASCAPAARCATPATARTASCTRS